MVGKNAVAVRIKPGRKRLPGLLCAGALATAFGAWVTGCSALIPGNNPLTTPNYRPVNTACDMEVSSPTLSAQNLRSLLHCFNAYGALDPIERLTQKLSDTELQPIADSLSKYVLNPASVYALDQSYQALDQQAKAQAAFQSLGKILENDEFVVSSLVLLKQAYFEPSSIPMSWFVSPPVDKKFLIAMNYLSQKMTAGNVGTGIDVALTATSAPAFLEIQRKFRGDSPQGHSLRELTDAALGYVQDPSQNKVPLGKEVLAGLIRGDLFRAIDDSIGGSSPENIQAGTDRLSSVFRATLSGNGEIFDGMTSLFSTMHVPLHCMKGTQTVPDGDMYLLSELARQDSSTVSDYMRVINPLTLISVNPFCNYPAGLATYYPSIIQLALSNAMEPSADLMKALYRSQTNDPVLGMRRPLAELFVDSLAEKSIKSVIPVLSELTNRGAWNDLILLGTLPREEDRDDISDALKFIYDPMPELNDTSVYDVLTNAIQRISPSDFYRFASSLKKFTDSDEQAFGPALHLARDFYYVNDTHPIAEAVRRVFEDAPQNEAFFTSVFKTVDTSEFQDSVKLLATMAKDGRLKQITDGLLALYRKYSLSGSVAIHSTSEPPFVPKSRHSLSEAELTPFPLVITPADPADPCSHLDLSFGVDQFPDSTYDEKLNNMVKCLSQHAGDPSILTDVQFLRSEKSGVNGLDYFQLPIQLIKNWDPSRDEVEYLSNSWLRNFDSGSFFNLLDTVPFFVDRSIGPQSGSATQFDSGDVLRPLFDLASPLITGDSRPKLSTLENFAAGELRRDDFPKTLKEAHELSQKELEPTYTPVVAQFDRARIKRWVQTKECERPDSADPEIRATQILDDFDNSLDNWSVQKGEPRRTWPLDEFKSVLAPTVQKVAQPKLSDGADRTLLDGFLNILRYMTLKPGQEPNQQQHYTPDEFIQWIKDRAEDYKLITLYHRDENGNFEDQPRVKLVNSLDRMELVMVEADFTVSVLGLEVVGNSSLQYTAELAEAWGDEPRELWPEPIQKLYPPGKKIRQIKDVIDDMYKSQAMFEDLVGLPEAPHCTQPADSDVPPWPKNRTGVHFAEIGLFRNVERSLFNLNQVLAVLEENRPLDPGEDPSHHLDPAHAGGMRVLRDIMYELYFSTPPKYRSYKLKDKDAWRNNLKVSDDLSRLGVFRALGQAVRRFKGNEQDLHDAFTSFLTSATLPQSHDAMVALFQNKRDPNQKVFWTAIQKIFQIFDNAEGVYTDQQKADLGRMPRAMADAQADEWVRDAARMKQLSYYSIALGQPTGITAPMMSAIATAMNAYPEYLANHADKIESLLRSQTTSYFMRALYEEPDPAKRELVARVVRNALNDPAIVTSALGLLQAVDNDQAASNSWTLFSDRKDALLALPEFQPYRQSYDRFNEDLISFFTDESSDPEGVMAADHLRHYMADLLQQGDLDQFLVLAKNDPNNFYQVLQTFSRYVENGELKEFFNRVRRSLSEPTR